MSITFPLVPLETLLRDSDIIIISCALNEHTKSLLLLLMRVRLMFVSVVAVYVGDDDDDDDDVIDYKNVFHYFPYLQCPSMI